MNKDIQRSYGRNKNQLRPLHVTYNRFGYGSASVLLEIGNTKVQAAVTLQPGVPSFMRGKGATKGEGWLTAEYSMLPTSTMHRLVRESSSGKRNPRSMEISRLIGRSLRIAVDLKVLGERTIIIDCDVLQADGGTRTACISAAYLALERAEQVWLRKKIIVQPLLKEQIAAISVGIRDDQVLLDLDFAEDSTVDADCNFVMTRSGNIIEVQSTAEKSPIAWDVFNKARDVAFEGIQQLFVFFEQIDKKSKKNHEHFNNDRIKKTPFFSLQNRQNSAS